MVLEGPLIHHLEVSKQGFVLATPGHHIARPAGMVISVAVRILGAGAEPHVPIEPRRERLGWEVLILAHAATRYIGQFHFADPPRMHHFKRLAVTGRIALLQTGLENPLVAAYRLHHRSGLPNRQGDRLFAIDVLAGLRGPHGHGWVPTLAGGNDDCIDIVAGQQFTKVAIRLEAVKQAARLPGTVGLLQDVRHLVAAPWVDVAECNKLDVRIPREDAEMAAAHHPDTDDADGGPIARCGRTILSEHSCWNHKRRGD